MYKQLLMARKLRFAAMQFDLINVQCSFLRSYKRVVSLVYRVSAGGERMFAHALLTLRGQWLPITTL